MIRKRVPLSLHTDGDILLATAARLCIGEVEVRGVAKEATTLTVFMRIFRQDSMTVFSRMVIERKTNGLELALALDNTGSMWGSKFSAMQTAAFDLVSIIYGGETVVDNMWVSIVH